MTDKNRVYIFDTTMRDGEQSPGASMSLEEKIQIARVFDELGIDIIEAGFPIASPGDFEAVTEISKILKKSVPAGLSRHSKKDIDRCYEALKHSKRFRIHTFISTSPLHMKHKLNKSPEEVYESIKEHVTYARKFTDDVEWSCEDGTRTDMDYMCKTVELAIKCGARTINIPDTVGYTVPSEFTKIIQTLLNKVPNIDKAILSVHCHNDLGLGVAKSLPGVLGGAKKFDGQKMELVKRGGKPPL
jgi:Isopropylmalate/homocitrate/citramalate synthases